MNNSKSAIIPIAILSVFLLLPAMAELAQAPQQAVTKPSQPHFEMLLAMLPAVLESDKLSKTGDFFAQKGNWRQAIQDYHQALEKEPSNPSAQYGLAKCYAALGDTSKEVACYRAAIYGPEYIGKTVDGTSFSGPFIIRETNNGRLMDFALVLSRIGQTAEALSVYNHAVGLLNYQDGKQHLKVMLPELGNGPSQMRYTPQRLEAMVDVALSRDMGNLGDDQGQEEHLLAAIKLWPDSPVAYYYLGQELVLPGHWDEARAAYALALKHSSGQQMEVVRDAIKHAPVYHDYARASEPVRRMLKAAGAM